ncbi:PE family protein [Mycobacterium talmoniae]|uniref:PE family protein n=1 Tax=Mycobacterium talmoniae TaxID=1858794 RepID=A0A1S1NPT8_9MYCO|nr:MULTISPECIES: PE family protein [Mycobacterium]OHV06543.1 PE family protein [Mycobacterium talmoniae]TDH56084.1 PE family protein [Mycobacterium eburneum]
MSQETTQHAVLAVAAANLAGLGLSMTAHNAAAAMPTTGLLPAAADEVSTLIAAQFAAHAQMYQEATAQASALHRAVVGKLTSLIGSDATTNPPARSQSTKGAV